MRKKAKEEQVARIGEMEVHRFASSLPMASPRILEGMADSIKNNGQRRPITLLDGRILDGRNRYAACLAAGVEPKFCNYDGPTDEASLANYVDDENIGRRQMTEAQCMWSRQRLQEHIRQRGKRSKDQAWLPNVDKASADQIKQLESGGIEELKSAVERGDIDLADAAEAASFSPGDQAEIVREALRPDDASPRRHRAEPKSNIVLNGFDVSTMEETCSAAVLPKLDALRSPEMVVVCGLLRRILERGK